MSLFIHNPKASSIRGRFINGAPITVYIEGDDDKNFWYRHFEDAGYKVAVIGVGGISNLEGYKQQICLFPEVAKYIVAQDYDYNYYTSLEKYSHPRIINTYGYSVENTMFCIPNINNIICKYAKTPGHNYDNEIEEWLTKLLNNLLEVIIYDIVNRKIDLGIDILKHSARFIYENQTINHSQIDAIRNEISKKVAKEELEVIKKHIKEDPRPLTAIIRGHALTYPILNYIISKTKKIRGCKINFSKDNLYAETECCSSNCLNCADHLHLKNSITKAIIDIQNPSNIFH